MKSSTALKMKSSRGSDEIEACVFDEMKSTHSPSRRISSSAGGFHRRSRFHPPERVDFVALLRSKACAFEVVAEQKARVTYDNLLRLIDDPDVLDPIRYLREREVVHYQRFGDAVRIAQDNTNSKNFYAINPAFDKKKK